MKLELTNDFHNTKCYILVSDTYYGSRISSKQIKRAQNILCGIKDCQCSNSIGIRGKQYREGRGNFHIKFGLDNKDKIYGIIFWEEK